jgi:hypothetical protein
VAAFIDRQAAGVVSLKQSGGHRHRLSLATAALGRQALKGSRHRRRPTGGLSAGRPAPALDEETIARLHAYPWPGNVRELRSLIERALVLHPEQGLAALDFAPEPIRSEAPVASAAASAPPAAPG